ncbi:hypothetical protein [Comamonas granuli]|nr:hypothetical protein [Comamonas granuli]
MSTDLPAAENGIVQGGLFTCCLPRGASSQQAAPFAALLKKGVRMAKF